MMDVVNQEAVIPDKWRGSVATIVAVGKLVMAEEGRRSPKELELWSWGRLGLGITTAQKIRTVARHRILSDPKYYDKLPAQWATLAKLALVPDEILLQIIADGSVLKMTRTDIAMLHNRRIKEAGTLQQPLVHRGEDGSKRRSYLKTPEGMTPTEWARQGLALEVEKELSPTEVAYAQGMAEKTYLKIRPLILLSENPDLPPQETAVVKAALAAIDRFGRLKLPEVEAAQKVVAQFWRADPRGRFFIRAGVKAEAKRKRDWQHALVLICDTCTNGAEIHVPFLSKEEAAQAMEKLSNARQSLRRLSNRLWRQGNDQ